MNVFCLKILTPEHEFFTGDAEAFIAEALDGQICVEANHAPLVAPVVAGEIKIRQNGEWRSAFNSEGFIEVTHNSVTLFAQACEWPENIDVRRAEEAAKRARERLRQKQSIAEFKSSKISLARAMARLRVTGHNDIK